MTRTISAMELRRSLGAVLNEVALQEHEIIVERAGKPLVRLTPAHSTPAHAKNARQRAVSAMRGIGIKYAAAGDAQEWINRLRAEDEDREKGLYR